MISKQSFFREQIAELYSANQQWLKRWLYHRSGCSHRAADLLQDTFVRLLVRDEQVLAREPRAYLTTIAKRVLIDHWRRQSVEQAYLEALAQQPETYSPSPEEQYLVLETLVAIDQLLDGLPALAKRAFLHAQLDGMKHKDIADALGVSVSSVKRYLIMAATQCYFSCAVYPDAP